MLFFSNFHALYRYRHANIYIEEVKKVDINFFNLCKVWSYLINHFMLIGRRRKIEEIGREKTNKKMEISIEKRRRKEYRSAKVGTR